MRRFAVTLIFPLLAIGLLAGCGGSSAQSSTTTPAVTVSGAFGKNPTITIPAHSALEASATWSISRQYLAVVRATDITDARPLIRPGVFDVGRTISLVLQGSWE